MPLPSGGASNFFAQYYYTKIELNAGQLNTLYFTESEFLSTSAGAGDAGKPVKLNSSGLIDTTMMSGGTVATHAALTAAHGATGAVVGTTNTQTLTNKTITGGTVNPTTLQQGGVQAVTTTGTQTLTNKTLTAPIINGSVGFGTNSAATQVHISNSNGVELRLSDSGATTDAEVNTYLAFYRGDTTLRIGYAGFPSSVNTNLEIKNEISGGALLLTADTVTVGGATVTTASNTQTLTNKTLTTPTIGSFTNATHNHSNAAGGGTIAHTALTSIGTNTHAQIDTAISASTSHIAATTGHGATGAVVGTTNTQTLTNKTITGGTVNATTLQQGGVQAVTTTGTQTLTNKTLTSPTIANITGPTNIVEGTKIFIFDPTDSGTSNPKLTAYDSGTAGTCPLEIAASTITFNPAAKGLILQTQTTPASATDTGTAGAVCWDTSYIYLCTSANVWRRVAHSTW